MTQGSIRIMQAPTCTLHPFQNLEALPHPLEHANPARRTQTTSTFFTLTLPTAPTRMWDPPAKDTKPEKDYGVQRKKLRRCTYLSSYDELLFKAIRDVNAHKAGNGTKRK